MTPPIQVEHDDCRNGQVAVVAVADLDTGFYVIQAGGPEPRYAHGPYRLGPELDADIADANDGGNNQVELLVVSSTGALTVPPELIDQPTL